MFRKYSSVAELLPQNLNAIYTLYWPGICTGRRALHIILVNFFPWEIPGSHKGLWKWGLFQSICGWGCISALPLVAHCVLALLLLPWLNKYLIALSISMDQADTKKETKAVESYNETGVSLSDKSNETIILRLSDISGKDVSLNRFKNCKVQLCGRASPSKSECYIYTLLARDLYRKESTTYYISKFFSMRDPRVAQKTLKMRPFSVNLWARLCFCPSASCALGFGAAAATLVKSVACSLYGALWSQLANVSVKQINKSRNLVFAQLFSKLSWPKSSSISFIAASARSSHSS